MTTETGLSGQVAYGVETTWATAAARTVHLPVVGESMKQDKPPLESAGVRAGERVLHKDQIRTDGPITVSGDISHELYGENMHDLMKAMIGPVTATNPSGSNYQHDYEPGDLASLTVEVGRPAIGGTHHRFVYTGCMVDEWELAVAYGEFATLGLSLTGKDETTGGVVTAQALSTQEPLTFVDGTIRIAGSAVNVIDATMSGNNGLNTDRRFIGSQTIVQQKEAALRPVTGTLTGEFEDLTAYNRFVNGDIVTVELDILDGDGKGISVVTTVVFTGETPNVSGTDVVAQNLPFMMVKDPANADTTKGIEIAVVNSTATP